MIQHTRLIDQFSENINWNAFSYITSKILTTALSFVLYKTLSTTDFSLWANVQSFIFLSLLWLDCGFRKSIPRFIPEISQHGSFYGMFIKNIFLFRVGTLLLALPLFYWLISSLLSSLCETHHAPSVLYGIIGSIFLVEGVVSLLRIFFHAHLWSKQFNTVYTLSVIGEMSCNTLLIYTVSTSSDLVIALLLSKLASGLTTMTVTAVQLFRAIRNRPFHSENNLRPAPSSIVNRFIIHSGAMWANNTARSLSERNFMLPLLTYTLGPASANMYKVANDGALLLYRSVFKTIGSTDTALLSQIKTATDQDDMRGLLLEKISKTLILLCAISLTIGACVSQWVSSYSVKPSLLQIFTLLLMSYILEILLSPYERILEVDQRYKHLFYSFAPYLMGMIIILITPLALYLGLTKTLMLICGMRLASSLLTTFYANADSNSSFYFPFAYARTIFAYFIVSNGMIHLLKIFCQKRLF